MAITFGIGPQIRKLLANLQLVMPGRLFGTSYFGDTVYILLFRLQDRTKKYKCSQDRQYKGTSQLVTWSTRHTVKWCAELTVVSDGVVMS